MSRYRGGDGRLKPGWRILAFIGLFYLFALPATLVVQLMIRGAGLGGAEAAAMKGAMVAIVATAAIWIGRPRLDRKTVVSLGLARTGATSDLVGGFLIGGVFVALAVFVQVWLGWATVEPSSGTVWTMVLLFVGTAGGIAWFEELVFRGYILQNTIEGLGTRRAVVLMTVVGGLVHTLNPNASVISTMLVAAIGLQHIAAYLWSRQLWLAIGTHAGWNFFQGAVFGMAVSGRPNESLFTTTFSGPEWASGGAFGLEAGIFGAIWAFGGMGVIWLWCVARRAPGPR